jgi:hypothetical protein
MDVADRVAVEDYMDMLERMMRTNTHVTKHIDKVKQTLASLRTYERHLNKHDLTFINICRHYIDEQLQWNEEINRATK